MENIMERLKNKIFALETNLYTLKRRLNAIPHSDDTAQIISEMEHSIEQAKLLIQEK